MIASSPSRSSRVTSRTSLRICGTEAMPPPASKEQLCLALHQRPAGWNKNVWLAQIAVPFRYLVFEDRVVAKRVPRQHGHFAMVLMRVAARVAQDHIGRRASFQGLEPNLDVGSLV